MRWVGSLVRKTNLRTDDGNGDVINLPPSLSFLSGRTLDGIITFITALPTLLYSFEASSPKPRNMKTMMDDTGIAHQNNNVSLRDSRLIKSQI